MQSKFSEVWAMLHEIANDWSEHRAAQLGAALAYYSVFSLGPLLLITIAIASFVFGEQAAAGELYASLANYIGDNGAKAIEAMVAGARTRTNTNSTGYATVVSLGLLIFTATAVVVQLKDALNIIWGVPAEQTAGFRVVLRKYLMSVVAVMGLGFLLLTSLITTTALAFFSHHVSKFLPLSADLLQFLNTMVSFGVVMLLFALMFRYLPDTQTEWRDVWIGAAGTALLFTIGKSLIGLYLAKQSIESTYGAAGSLILLLLWVYYSSQIVFIGAEFTQVYSRRYGSRAQLGGFGPSSTSRPPPQPPGNRPRIRLVGGNDFDRSPTPPSRR